jgi:hypothetical protein
MAKLTSSGPIVVPKLFTPPAIVSLCDPVLGSPMIIASGFAAVCCNENPRPTIKSPVINRLKEAVCAAG